MSELECNCPNGHPLPHIGPKGECTPVRCGGEGVARKLKEPRGDAARGGNEDDFRERKNRAERFAKEMEVPAGLEGAEAEEWAAKRVATLLPFAVARLEYDLLYTQDKELQQKARDRILDAGGITKKDAVSGGQQIIILNGVGSPAEWLKGTKKAPQVVEGTVVGGLLPEKEKVK
jgi:hypothetical protein